jgi:hypothetical protein
MRWPVVLLLVTSCGRAEDDARSAGRRVESEVRDVVGTAATVKRELDQVYRTTYDYDLTVGVGPDDEAKLAALPHVDVGGVAVGYEEHPGVTLRGVTYTKHFRAIWRRDGRTYGVSFYSKQELDVKELGELLGHLVPIVERLA